MPNWECENCGKQLESDLEPRQCPCGSEDIEAKEQLSMLEQMMQDYIKKDDENRAKS